jgi:hypothetical protein
MEKRLFNRNDMFLLLGMFLGLTVISMWLLVTKTGGNKVSVSVDGVEQIAFSLDEDLEYEIDGYNGGTNLLMIKNGSAFLLNASCPDHLCVKMGKIRNVGQSIICLPNRVVIEIKGGKDGSSTEYDTKTY